MPTDDTQLEGAGRLYRPGSGVGWTGRYQVAARVRRNAPSHQTYGAFLADSDIDVGLLDDFMAGMDLLLTLETGQTVKVKIGGMSHRKLVLIGARLQ